MQISHARGRWFETSRAHSGWAPRDTARAMSGRDQEIISSLRGAYEAFNRADFDAAMEVAHPEIEFVPPGGQSPRRGADALRAWMEPDAFESQQIQPVEFRVQGDKVLVHQLAKARGAGSGGSIFSPCGDSASRSAATTSGFIGFCRIWSSEPTLAVDRGREHGPVRARHYFRPVRVGVF